MSEIGVKNISNIFQHRLFYIGLYFNKNYDSISKRLKYLTRHCTTIVILFTIKWKSYALCQNHLESEINYRMQVVIVQVILLLMSCRGLSNLHSH